jgi:hypothetical protein
VSGADAECRRAQRRLRLQAVAFYGAFLIFAAFMLWLDHPRERALGRSAGRMCRYECNDLDPGWLLNSSNPLSPLAPGPR